MKKFVVERHLHCAGNLSPGELKNMAEVSYTAINAMGRPYHWVQSYVTDNKIYCVHIVEKEKETGEHETLGKLPITSIAELRSIFDPVTGS